LDKNWPYNIPLFYNHPYKKNIDLKNYSRKSLAIYKLSYFSSFTYIYCTDVLLISLVYIIKLFAHIFVYLIADQTAGPNWLTFFEGTHGYHRG